MVLANALKFQRNMHFGNVERQIARIAGIAKQLAFGKPEKHSPANLIAGNSPCSKPLRKTHDEAFNFQFWQLRRFWQSLRTNAA